MGLDAASDGRIVNYHLLQLDSRTFSRAALACRQFCQNLKRTPCTWYKANVNKPPTKSVIIFWLAKNKYTYQQNIQIAGANYSAPFYILIYQENSSPHKHPHPAQKFHVLWAQLRTFSFQEHTLHVQQCFQPRKRTESRTTCVQEKRRCQFSTAKLLYTQISIPFFQIDLQRKVVCAKSNKFHAILELRIVAEIVAIVRVLVLKQKYCSYSHFLAIFSERARRLSEFHYIAWDPFTLSFSRKRNSD